MNWIKYWMLSFKERAAKGGYVCEEEKTYPGSFCTTLKGFGNVNVNVFTDKDSLAEFLQEIGFCGESEEVARQHNGLAWHLENYKEGKSAFIMYLPDLSDIRTIYHECLHTGWHVLAFLGIEVDADNHEVLAYLQSHLADEVLQHKSQK